MSNQLIVLLLYLITAPVLNSEPLVQISQGILSGIIEKSRNGRNYSAFLGIPYGKPPVGDLRFKNPLPANKWNGIREAKSFGNECIHTLFGIATFGKEDCLFLNVYSPFLEFQEKMKINDTLLPVMVFIHGGIFFFGGSNNYNATYFLDKDIIFVTLNYRQGIFGFLSTADSVAPGNFGLKDQVLALKWIQENIQAFGGDKNRVTLFGISSGSVCVHFHTLSKASDDLFHQYILHSGTALSSWAYRDRNEILKTVKKIAKFASCPTESTESLMNCLRKTDAQNLLFLSNIVGLIVRNAELAWVPTNELNNEDAFLTDNPENLMDQMKDMPFISGVAENEALFFTNYFYTIKPLHNILKKFMKKLFIDDAIYIRNAKKSFPENLYQFYFNNSKHLTEKRKDLDIYTDILSDGLFIYPEIRMLDQITPKMENPTYFFNYGYRGDVPNFSSSISKINLGVGHGSELIYLFPYTYFILKRTDADFSNTDRNISKLFIDLWTSFAANGVPTSEFLNPPDLWKPYNTKNNHFLQIGDENDNMNPLVKLSNNFSTERMNFWRDNFPL